MPAPVPVFSPGFRACFGLYVRPGSSAVSGSAKKSNEFVFLLSPFAIFREDRMRLGRVQLRKLRFHLPLLSPFAIFREDRMRSAESNCENFVFICLCSRLSLSLYGDARASLRKLHVMSSSRLPENRVADFSDSGIFFKRLRPGIPVEPLRSTHRDDYWLFGVVEQGECLFSVDFREWRCRAGEAMAVLPGQVHAFLRGQSLDALLLFVDASCVSRELRLRFEEWAAHPAPITLPASCRRELQLLGQLLESCGTDARTPFRRLALRHLALAVAALLAEALPEGEQPAGAARRHAELTAAFRNLLAEELGRHHNPSYYAERLHVSRSYLCEAVRRTTGQSISRTIRDEVVLRAKRLLAHSDLSVQQIAAELGFDDSAYFSRLFARASALSPSAFRDKYRG